MKTSVINLLLAALLGMAAVGPGEAQVLDPGYWVVETNAKTRDYSIVTFYNQDHEMVYEERLDGVYLNINRRKTKKMLNQTLQKVMEKSLVKGQIKKDTQPVAVKLARKRE